MTNIRLEAYKIIVKVLSKNIFSDKLLRKMSKRLRESGENADFLYALVKGTIKMQAHLDHIASTFIEPQKYKKTHKKIKILLYIALYQIKYMENVPSHAAVNETVNLAKELFDRKVANFINAVIRNYLRKI
jgi:16S rRNA (cytosine967-C5)-methyltransferase